MPGGSGRREHPQPDRRGCIRSAVVVGHEDVGVHADRDGHVQRVETAEVPTGQQPALAEQGPVDIHEFQSVQHRGDGCLVEPTRHARRRSSVSRSTEDMASEPVARASLNQEASPSDSGPATTSLAAAEASR